MTPSDCAEALGLGGEAREAERSSIPGCGWPRGYPPENDDSPHVSPFTRRNAVLSQLAFGIAKRLHIARIVPIGR